jgi:hypothetical protein
MLTKISDAIWTTERSQRFWGLETGTRMNVVRLSSGGLFIHCPVALDAELRRQIDALGEVVAVAASSLYHHLYAGDWMRAYPGALACGCPGLARKRPDLPFGLELGDEAHPLWKADLDQIYFSARFEREVVFYHQQERTLICADALLNLSAHPSRATRLAAKLMGNTAPGKGYLERIAVRDWALGRKQVDRILEWDVGRILLAHGAIVERDGREVIREAYAWL